MTIILSKAEEGPGRHNFMPAGTFGLWRAKIVELPPALFAKNFAFFLDGFDSMDKIEQFIDEVYRIIYDFDDCISIHFLLK